MLPGHPSLQATSFLTCHSGEQITPQRPRRGYKPTISPFPRSLPVPCWSQPMCSVCVWRREAAGMGRIWGGQPFLPGQRPLVFQARVNPNALALDRGYGCSLSGLILSQWVCMKEKGRLQPRNAWNAQERTPFRGAGGRGLAWPPSATVFLFWVPPTSGTGARAAPGDPRTWGEPHLLVLGGPQPPPL